MSEQVETASSVINSTTEFKLLPIEMLCSGQYQPRQYFDKAMLRELATSITQQGIIQPILVKESGLNNYEIIAGERRWRAAQLAQLEKVPCIIRRQDDDETTALLALVENLQREDLNPMEEAQAYQRLFKEFNYHPVNIAEKAGKSRAEIINKLNLLELHPAIQEFIRKGDLTAGHTKILVGLKLDAQLALAKLSIENKWSVRQIERAVKDYKQPKGSSAGAALKDPNLQKLQQQLGDYFGSKTQLAAQTKKSGQRTGYQLTVQFSNTDIFEGFLDKIGFHDSD